MLLRLGGELHKSKNYWFVPDKSDETIIKLQEVNVKRSAPANSTNECITDAVDTTDLDDSNIVMSPTEPNNEEHDDSNTSSDSDSNPDDQYETLEASEDGYVIVGWDGEYPIYEHRLIAEKRHGRLRPGEEVHHINRIKDDNRWFNLVVISHRAHRKLHRTAGWHEACQRSQSNRPTPLGKPK